MLLLHVYPDHQVHASKTSSTSTQVTRSARKLSWLGFILAARALTNSPWEVHLIMQNSSYKVRLLKRQRQRVKNHGQSQEWCDTRSNACLIPGSPGLHAEPSGSQGKQARTQCNVAALHLHICTYTSTHIISCTSALTQILHIISCACVSSSVAKTPNATLLLCNSCTLNTTYGMFIAAVSNSVAKYARSPKKSSCVLSSIGDSIALTFKSDPVSSSSPSPH
jgi:hypothetical protein